MVFEIRTWSSSKLNHKRVKKLTEDAILQASQVHSVKLCSIKIPKATGIKIARRLHRSGFSSVDEYSAFILDSVLEYLERIPSSLTPNRKVILSEGDLEKIREEIRPLASAYP